MNQRVDQRKNFYLSFGLTSPDLLRVCGYELLTASERCWGIRCEIKRWNGSYRSWFVAILSHRAILEWMRLITMPGKFRYQNHAFSDIELRWCLVFSHHHIATTANDHPMLQPHYWWCILDFEAGLRHAAHSILCILLSKIHFNFKLFAS